MHTYEHGERVHICGGPVEVPCPGCGRPACETAPDADGVIINGPTRVTFRCRCGRR